MKAKATRRLVIRKDRTKETLEALQSLVRQQVLVGIPESTSDRDDEDGSGLTNAQIGYLQETGCPETNLPARPFLVPGTEEAEDRTVPLLKEAAKATLRGNPEKARAQLSDAGIVASNSVKRRINSNIPPPLSPYTVANRARSRGSKTSRASERAYLRMVALGADPGEAQDEAGIIALVNTGQLRNSITSVVRKK